MKPSLLCIVILISSIKSFATVKEVAKQAPAKTISNFAESLSNQSDSEKVQAICYWIAHTIAWDTKSFNKSQKLQFKSSTEVIKSKTGKSEDYAQLVKDLCDLMQIRCVVLFGYEKNELYENGAGFYKPNHAWNAVMINNRWTLVDAYNAAGDIYMDLNWWKQQLQKIHKKKIYTSTKFKFKFDYQPEFIFQDPEEVRLTRVPIDPLWQLTDTIMPLSIFEKSEHDITEFNEKYSNPKLFSLKLSEIYKLNDDAQIIECADRTYAYNPRYTEMKANKHIALANENLKKVNASEDISNAKKFVDQSKTDFSIAKDILGKQKEQINKEFTELRKVNSEKKMDVSKYKQTFTVANTKHLAKLSMRMSATSSKSEAFLTDAKSKTKQNDDLNATHFASIKTPTPNKQASEQDAKKLNDSLYSRSNSVSEGKRKLDLLTSNIELLQLNKNSTTDSMSFYLSKTTDGLNKEIRARSKKQDSFDDSIKVLHSKLYFYKITKLDSFQNAYFTLYDSILELHNQMKLVEGTQIELTKKNLQDLESYKKLWSTNENLASIYTAQVEAYQSSQKNYMHNALVAAAFIKNETKLMQQLKSVYSEQNHYFENLSNNESDRKEYVKKLLDKSESIDKRHTEQRKDIVKKAKTDLDKDFKKLKAKKKKRSELVT